MNNMCNGLALMQMSTQPIDYNRGQPNLNGTDTEVDLLLEFLKEVTVPKSNIFLIHRLDSMILELNLY